MKSGQRAKADRVIGKDLRQARCAVRAESGDAAALLY